MRNFIFGLLPPSLSKDTERASTRHQQLQFSSTTHHAPITRRYSLSRVRSTRVTSDPAASKSHWILVSIVFILALHQITPQGCMIV
jgi:hypothetical protein